MKVLVACEESQTVTKAFRKLGHEAYSCDIQECSGGHLEWHLRQDVTELLKQDWDAVIAFPPCTHLAVSGSRHFAAKRMDGRQQEGIAFFELFTKLDHIPLVAIENPVGIMSSLFRKPNQIINPFQFGHPEAKKTCLWLKGFPSLLETNRLPLPECGHWENQTKERQNKLLVDGVWIGWNDPRTAKLRSKTYQGIADAMAAQWGGALSPCGAST
jgi:hypothetical protein